MRLYRRVLDFISQVRERPVLGSDPKELSSLAEAARGDWGDSFEAQHVPLAEWTWEVRLTFPSGAAVNNDTSQRVAIKFPSEVQIIAFIPTLVPLGGAGIVPTLNDIACRVDVNKKAELTDRDSITTPAGTSEDSQFVTLFALSILAPRLMGIRLASRNPEVGFTFRWERGGAVYQDTIVKMAAACRFYGKHSVDVE